MGGDAAPKSPDDAARTQVRLAASTDPDVLVSGHYFSERDWRPSGSSQDPALLDDLLARCGDLTCVQLPEEAPAPHGRPAP